MRKLIQYQTKDSLYDGPFGEGSGIGWRSAGMGYVIVTENGHLIVIDGGHINDGEDFLALLEANHTDKPVVDYWIITHPHIDHFGALRTICQSENLYSRLKIKTLVYRFPEDFGGNAEWMENVRQTFETILSVTEAEHIIPERGDVISADGDAIRFFYVPDEEGMEGSPNTLSLIFSVGAEDGSGKKAVFTGDAYPHSLSLTSSRYGSELKCDILQLPHHGLCDTGHLEFYRHADAETLLIPTSIAGDRAMHSGYYKNETAANDWAAENARFIYREYEGTTEIPLEY